MPSPRVLVIEDDGDVLRLLTSHLVRLGCEVTGAATGELGLALAQQDPPDAVLVDMLLPGIDGAQVVEQLRGSARTAGCRVVISSILDPGDYVDVPADATLRKPFTRNDVNTVVTALQLQGMSS